MTKKLAHCILTMLALGGMWLASCQPQPAGNWTTFQDPRGVAAQIPAGWKGALDSDSTMVTFNGPRGAEMIVWPTFFDQPLNPQVASTLLQQVGSRLVPGAAWTNPAPAGPGALRMNTSNTTQPTVCSVTWVNSPRGAAAYFVRTTAPQTEFASLAPAFARIFTSLQLSPSQGGATPQPSVRWSDPRENAFSIEVPANWRADGGTFRRAAVDLVASLVVTSPDGATRITGGDPEIPVFTVPNQMLQMAGFREGSWYSPGYGVRMLVSRYQPGLAFIRSYVESRVGQRCAGVQISQQQDRTRDFAGINAQYAQLQQSGMRVQLTAGEVAFTCRMNGRPMAGYYFASTALAQSQASGIWMVDQLFGYITPAEAEPTAQTAMGHILETFQYNPDWVRMQQGVTMATTKIVSQTQAEISKMSRSSFELRQGVNSEASRKRSNAMLGVVDVRDPQTGREFKADNSANFRWIDNNGRIIGTQTDTKPAGIDARLLVTLP